MKHEVPNSEIIRKVYNQLRKSVRTGKPITNLSTDYEAIFVRHFRRRFPKQEEKIYYGMQIFLYSKLTNVIRSGGTFNNCLREINQFFDEDGMPEVCKTLWDLELLKVVRFRGGEKITIAGREDCIKAMLKIKEKIKWKMD